MDALESPSNAASVPRKIVLCFDGTGDWIGKDHTNVAKLFGALDEDRDLCYYDGGVGTLLDYGALSTFRRAVLNVLDLANANGLREKVLQGYVFLVRHHRPGDEVYFFGFSRGAHTARLVAAMVQAFGILRPGAENVVPYLWQSFVAPVPFSVFKPGARTLQGEFALAEPARIRFMGLFDTVSSVGLIDRFRIYPFSTYNQGVERTCHAVSIEESRNMFPESLMDPAQPNLTEVWFPGVHRDAGGGGDPARSRIADEALLWMEIEAERAGLAFRYHHLPDRSQPPVANAAAFDVYVLAGGVPLMVFDKRVDGYRLYWPNFVHARPMPDGVLVHEVAREAFGLPGGPGAPPNMPEERAWFRTGDDARSPRVQDVAEPCRGVADLVGCALGIGMVLLLSNAAAGSPLGRSWPGPRGWAEVALLVLLVAAQGVGRSAMARLPRGLRLSPDRALAVLGAAVLFASPLAFHGEPLLYAGLAAGSILWACAQTGRLPVTPAARALPYALVGAVVSALACLAAWIASRWLPGVGALRPWLVAPGLAAVAAGYPLVLRDRLRMRDLARASSSPTAGAGNRK